MIKYQSVVTFIGPMVDEFLSSGILVLFGEQAPEELRDFAIIHDGKDLLEPVTAGDKVEIGGTPFQILAVGEVANDNLANLGHLVLKFNGEPTVEMPGDVCLEAMTIPPVKIGDVLRITS